MTTLLEEAFTKASALPADLQDLLADEFLKEIEWEMKWDKTFANSQKALDKLTERAMAEYREGTTEVKGFDEL